MSGKTADRRSFIRIPFKTTVRLDAGGGIMHADGKTDISMSGIRVPHAGPAPGAAACRVTIILKEPPDEIAIRAAGRIIRSARGSVAVEFTELDPDSYNHLQRLILNNAADPEKAEQEFESHWGIKRRG